ncbi:MAG: hypothetical protein QOC56_1062 [Alphaproteobacteria bacterium]|nr:hypothetical protein [Alphaproteobacteria bacterium]
MDVGHVCARAGSVVLVALAAASAASTLSGPALAAEVPDLSGIYWTTRYSAKIELLGGGELPFTPAGKAAYEKNIAGLKDGSIKDEARRLCVPDGLPRVLASPYPFEIVQAPPGVVTILHELNHQVRVVRLDKPMPSYEELVVRLAYNGYSVGRYEGDTLVVETSGFNSKTFADATGAPQSDELRTVERIRKISPTQLEIVITVHDSEYYTREWQTRFVYDLRNDLRIEDYVCGEEHRAISSVPGVRRP